MAQPTVDTPELSKSQLAFDWIQEHINDGSFGPGYRLVLSQLADEIGVSVVPVREALRRLEAMNLVTFERNVGAHVAAIDPMEYLHTMQTLSLVEGAAIRLSVPFITAEAIERARSINRQLAECLDNFDPRHFTELNLKFHAVLFENCKNPHILDLVHRGWRRMTMLRESTFSFVPGRARESVREHEELLRLIESGASELEIELAARGHREATLDAFLDYEAGKQTARPTVKEGHTS